jgi:hypothetical protein
MRNRIFEVVKSTLSVIRSMDSQEIEIMKAKRRNEGEVWTQPSGRKVTKRGGHIIPVSDHKKKAAEPKLNPPVTNTSKPVVAYSFENDRGMSGKDRMHYLDDKKENKILAQPLKIGKVFNFGGGRMGLVKNLVEKEYSKDTTLISDYGNITVPKGYKSFSVEYHPYDYENEGDFHLNRVEEYRLFPGLTSTRYGKKKLSPEELKEVFYLDYPELKG